jgi:conjugal transfer mating pair stabilization protein TraN
MRVLAGLLALYAAVSPAAAQQSVRDDAKAFAQPLAAAAANTADDQNAAAANLPGYNGGNAPERAYLDNAPALEAARVSAARSNEAAVLVIDGSSARPQVPSSLVDETVARGETINQDPATFARGVDANGTPGQCVELPPSTNSPGNFEARCNAGAELIPEARSCNVTLRHNFTPSYLYTWTALHETGQVCVGSPGNCIARIPVDRVQQTGGSAFVAPVCTSVRNASTDLGPGPTYGVTGTHEADMYLESYTATCTAPVQGILAGSSYTSYLGGATTSASFSGPTVQSIYLGSAQDLSQCSGLATDPGCLSPVDVCTDASPVTRDVGGTMVTQACWAWSRTYQCHRLSSNNDCTALAANPACHYARTECLDDPQVGACKVEERVYTCPIPGAVNSPKQFVCGGDIYCVGGDCEAVTRDASDEFKDAVVGLESLAQANREFSNIDFKLFKGSVMGCHKPIFGLVNCCAGKSSGLIATSTGFAALAGGPAAIGLLATPLLTLFLCSASEKEFDVRDRMGLCHTLGTYCSSSFLGICSSKRTTACCFLSKLTRILQEQGRAQLGKGWGVPKTPDCAGFTAAEFAALDLSKMDFTEVYKEFVDAAKLPNEAATMTDIQAKIQAYYARGGPK